MNGEEFKKHMEKFSKIREEFNAEMAKLNTDEQLLHVLISKKKDILYNSKINEMLNRIKN